MSDQRNGSGADEKASLREVESHFAFGENWKSYADLIDKERISSAITGLARLLGSDEIRDKRFLDIGSGSGLHSLSALELGAREVLAVDIDINSVNTTRSVLGRHATGKNFRVEQMSVFCMDVEKCGAFDVVYSWGVLHHTGDMFSALRHAAAMVSKGGIFAFALYRKTSFCWFWKIEKRFYAKMAPGLQRLVQKAYVALYRLAFFRGSREKFENHLAGYRARGMDYYHDVHDWLGGYPYESISPAEVDALMNELSFVAVRRFVHETKGRAALFGTGCDEYVFRRPL